FVLRTHLAWSHFFDRQTGLIAGVSDSYLAEPDRLRDDFGQRTCIHVPCHAVRPASKQFLSGPDERARIWRSIICASVALFLPFILWMSVIRPWWQKIRAQTPVLIASMIVITVMIAPVVQPE